MNKSQLERIRGNIAEIDKIIHEDPAGSKWVSDILENLEDQVVKELQSVIWGEYEERRR